MWCYFFESWTTSFTDLLLLKVNGTARRRTAIPESSFLKKEIVEIEIVWNKNDLQAASTTESADKYAEI